MTMRGWRIEPDELTAVLPEHPAAAPPTPDDLRDFLAARLPDYMVPVTFVLLENLPLTPNGKVNRAALPPPDDANTLRNGTFTAPRTDTEKTLAALLAPLLGLKEIDVEANFFTLGGHSLLGTQLIVRARNVFHVELPLRLIFESPSVAQLAAEIERLLRAKLETMSEAEVQDILNRTASLAAEPA